MQPMEVLGLVRQGFAVATREQAQLVRSCLEVDVVEDEWVPRWALEAETALAAAGYPPGRLTALFANGRGAVLAELGSLVKSGRRRRVLEPRGRWSPFAFDRRTQARLAGALEQHRAACDACAGAGTCFQAEQLADEIELLFPAERRKRPRVSRSPAEPQPGFVQQRRRGSSAPDVL